MAAVSRVPVTIHTSLAGSPRIRRRVLAPRTTTSSKCQHVEVWASPMSPGVRVPDCHLSLLSCVISFLVEAAWERGSCRPSIGIPYSFMVRSSINLFTMRSPISNIPMKYQKLCRQSDQVRAEVWWALPSAVVVTNSSSAQPSTNVTL